jgi:hypothetical protein
VIEHFLRLFDPRDVLAEPRENRVQALRLQRLGGLDRILDALPGMNLTTDRRTIFDFVARSRIHAFVDAQSRTFRITDMAGRFYFKHTNGTMKHMKA